jgi:hypothetical protein
MARYKDHSYEQTELVAVSYDRQILPGTFEFTLSEVIDTIDLSLFDNRYNNDETGATAYDPGILLKIVLFAYSKGVIYSRRIAQLCCLKGSVVTADTGFHSAGSLKYLEEEEIDGYVPDSNFRKRDSRFVTAGRYKRGGKGSDWEKDHFEHSDFTYVKKGDYFLCPAGNRLEHLKGVFISGTVSYGQYVSKQRQCNVCTFRTRCLTGANQKVRRVFLRSDRGEIYFEKMMKKIDTEEGRKIYSQRMKIVEPVFGNIRWAKGLSRFTLRSKRKVNVQWLLNCTVHNIEKILNFGCPAFA